MKENILFQQQQKQGSNLLVFQRKWEEWWVIPIFRAGMLCMAIWYVIWKEKLLYDV